MVIIISSDLIKGATKLCANSPRKNEGYLAINISWIDWNSKPRRGSDIDESLLRYVCQKSEYIWDDIDGRALPVRYYDYVYMFTSFGNNRRDKTILPRSNVVTNIFWNPPSKNWCRRWRWIWNLTVLFSTRALVLVYDEKYNGKKRR